VPGLPVSTISARPGRSGVAQLFFVARVPFELAAKYCGGDHFIALDNTRPIEFLLYLYFGKTTEDLKNFALRDLGIRTNKESSFSARFVDGDEARACFYYNQILDRIAIRSIGVYQRAATEILNGPTCTTEYASSESTVQESVDSAWW
jgi:DNA polymerase-3 subunit epsilon